MKLTITIEAEGPNECDDYVLTIPCLIRGDRVMHVHKDSTLILEALSVRSRKKPAPPPRKVDVPGADADEDQLLAFCAINGIKIDKRWGVKKLRDEISDWTRQQLATANVDIKEAVPS
jgi:hypothetical protein